MALLVHIVHRDDHVIDVGGNRGVYAYEFWRLGCTVDVFEPNLACSAVLESWRGNKHQVRLHKAALSSTTGEAKLHIPVDANGIEHDASASLEHDFPASRNQLIAIRTLDSFEFEDVALIKIDVEGHEQSVLTGAIRTIEASHPALLVEIEQRHNSQPISKIFAGIEDRGYRGFFLDTGRLRPLSDFIPQRDQPEAQFGLPNARYINNFLFLHMLQLEAGRYRDLGIPRS
jgi:FkbM family methyltransferase